MPFARFDRMTDQRLNQLLDRFRDARIAVLGDFFLDKYLDVEAGLAELSVETGKTAHQVVAVRCSPGAAGTVVANLAALEAGRIHAIGFTGDDGESYDLRKALVALGCDVEHLHYEPYRRTPTYLKPRDRADPSLAGEHERYDTKNRDVTSPATQQRILDSLDTLLPELDAVIVLDQAEEENCGVVTALVRDALADLAGGHPQVIFWADSRRRVRQFRNMMVKANQFELLGRENPPPGESVPLEILAEAIGSLRRQTAAPIFVTRSAEGMVVSDPEPALVPSVRVSSPTDPTGAGDSVTAGAVLALAAGADLPEAALIGNLVASITVQQLATTGTARPEDLAPRLAMWRRQQAGSA